MSSWIHEKSTLFKSFQVMNIAETELKSFWIKTDQRWMSPRRQPKYQSFFSVIQLTEMF